MRIHVNSCAATIHRTNVHRARWWETEHQKSRKFGNLQILIKVALSIGSHIGCNIWQPS